jgi:hypothetical protein
MACTTCGKSLIGKVSDAIAGVENKLFGNRQLNSSPAPSQQIGASSGNVFGDPASRIRANGTNHKYQK